MMSWPSKPEEAAHDSPRASQDSAVGSQDCGKPVHLPEALGLQDPLLDSDDLFVMFLVDHRRSAAVTEGLMMIF